jgi:hypothetical protein
LCRTRWPQGWASWPRASELGCRLARVPALVPACVFVRRSNPGWC